MTSLGDRCNHFVTELAIRHRLALFVAGSLLTALAAFYLLALRPLQYNRSMEGFFPKSDPALQLYQRYKEWFGGEATLLVVYHDPLLWTPEGMERQERLAQALRNLEPLGVKTVTALADSPAPGKPWMTVSQAIRESPQDAAVWQEKVRETALYQGVLLASDLHTTALLVQLRQYFATSEELGRCLVAVRTAAKEILGSQEPANGGVAVVGTHLLIHDVYEYTEADGQRLQIMSVAFMGVVIAVFFRSLRWIALPFLVIYAALFWGESLWALLRGELTMVSSAISSLAAVIGVSTVVHYGMHYRDLAKHGDAEAALRQTLRDMNPPIFWMLLTTAAGFASLLVCELKPVQDFAWIMVMITLLTGVATLCFLPFAVLTLRTTTKPELPAQELLTRLLEAGLKAVRLRPGMTTATLLPALGFASGVFWLKPQTDFTNNFRKDTEIFQAYSFVESQFGGAGQMDLVFSCPDLLALPEAELDQYLDRLRRLEAELKQLTVQEGGPPGVTKVLALTDFLDFLDQSLGGLDPGLARVAQRAFPLRLRLRVLMGDTAEAGKNLADAKALLDGLAGRLLRAEQRAAYKLTLEQIQHQLDRFQRSPPGRLFWNPEARKMRLTLQARERLSGSHKVALIAAAQQKAKEVLGEDSQPQATGIYPMLTRLIVNLLADQRLTFGLALACMFAMGLAAFRNLWLALISVIPTVIPIVAVLGTMGWLELPVNIATAMLASVAMGMTIDSSLVYLYRFRQEQQAGADFHTALQRTHARTGLALVVANIALVLGFAVLTWSRFVPLVHFGILTGLALLGGLIGNLLLLPLLLNLVPGFKGPGQAEEPAPNQGW